MDRRGIAVGGARRAASRGRIFGAGCLLALAASAAAAETAALFASTEPLELTLVAPMRALIGRSGRGGEHDALLRFASGAEVAVRLAAFGKSRLETCRLPPLVLRLTPEAGAGTPVTGFTTLRLVSPCRGHAVYERPLLLEYLTYRAYGLIAPTALDARLARVSYDDSEGKVAEETRYGFFVEDIDDAAARTGATWSTAEGQSVGEVESEQAAVHALFQFMIGNTDWSMVRGPEGERCCHNVALLERPGSARRLLLPYDFDQAGLVGAPYAAPSESLGIDDVSQRVYRGFCAHNDALPAAIARFNERRAALEELFLDPALPQEKARVAAWKYLSEFYEIVNQPKKLESRVVDRCRGRD